MVKGSRLFRLLCCRKRKAEEEVLEKEKMELEKIFKKNYEVMHVALMGEYVLCMIINNATFTYRKIGPRSYYRYRYQPVIVGPIGLNAGMLS